MIFVIGASSTANAAGEWHFGKVARMLNDSEYFGGCMANIPTYEPTISCKAAWVSVDCDGNFLPKPTARRMWEAVQISYSLEKPIAVYLSDEMKVNGYCVAARLDNTQ